MTSTLLTRNYILTDGEMSRAAKNIRRNVNREAADFAIRKIDAARIANFDAMIADFDNTPDDVEFVGIVAEKTSLKNDAAKELKKAMRSVRSMAAIAFDGKGKYNVFGFEGLIKLNDMALYRLCGRVVRVGNKFFALLATQGLTAAMLANITNLGNQFFQAIADMDEAAEEREIAGQDRVEKGNLLWKETTILASIGKSLYEDEDEARYNDFVLMD